MNETTIIGLPRRALTFAGAAALALVGTVTIAAQSEGAPNQGKVFVCKYVGTPGEDERLQTGQNPIQVSVNAIPGPGPVQVGYEFADRQGRSLVIGFVTDKKNEPEPVCPTTPPPTTPPPPPTTKTTPPPTTKTPPPTKTTNPPPTKTTHVPPPTTTPGDGGGGLVTPGVGAPDTGGDAEGLPVNAVIGTGLLLGAAGLVGHDLVSRRRRSPSA